MAVNDCLENKNNKVKMRRCDSSKPSQRWFTTDDDSTHFHVVSEFDKRCWAVEAIDSKKEKLVISDCDSNNDHQIFEFVNGQISHKEGSQDFCLQIKNGRSGIKMQACHVNRFGLLRSARLSAVVPSHKRVRIERKWRKYQ